jgi:hypothetical protein
MTPLLFILILFVLPIAAGILFTFIGKDLFSARRQFSMSEFLILVIALSITIWLFTAFIH